MQIPLLGNSMVNEHKSGQFAFLRLATMAQRGRGIKVKKYRSQCEANIYHITVRGTARQIVFEDDVDRRNFGMRMRRSLQINEAELYAWCFMSNHVHLLIHANLETVTKVMRGLLGSYAEYFNARHGRTGHLFESRFDSVPVQTEEQLMAAVRYIHRNPLAIPGQSIASFEWSSYQEYLGEPFICKTDFVYRLFNGRDEFIAFHESRQQEAYEWNAKRRFGAEELTDKEAVALALELLKVDSMASIAAFDKTTRDACLAKLRKTGMTINQVARITGIGRNIVQRAGK